MLREITMVPHLKAWVQTVLEFSAYAHRKVTLAGEGAGSIHELLEVSLNSTDDLVTVAVVIDLADVVNRRVQLIGVVGAELKEQCFAHCSKS